LKEYTNELNKYKTLTNKYSVRLEVAKVDLLKQHYGEESFTKIIEKLIDEKITGQVLPPPKKLNSPILRIGGKALLADKLIELMPEHKVYVDVFGGALHLLFAKESSTSKIEIVNDKSGDIINLFAVIKDRPLDLRAKILEMPTSRQYFNYLKSLPVSNDNVERAARFFYLVRNSYMGDPRTGWKASNKNNTNKLVGRIADELYWLSQRLQKVTLECMNYSYILRKYGNDKDAFMFCDPPYIIHNKKQGLYDIPFTESDNRELAKRLKELPAKIMVTHYDNKIFNSFYKGWRLQQIQSFKASGAIIAREEKDEQGNVITVREKPRVIENVFMNY
jgi:DNA adenine methylase